MRREGRAAALEIFPSYCLLLAVAFYTRRLPHWHPDDAEFFVTWRLYGSLPSFPSGVSFVSQDRELDRASTGPLWLKNARAAESVSEILLSGMTTWRFYELFAWVVMANHVHVLIHPLMPLRKVLMNIKSASARAANAALRRQGQPFWQEESYDHWVRSGREREQIIRYIDFNPVTAGLVGKPEEWPWSSAGWQGMAAHGATSQA
jgi:REP element-mobilizing transposase RayT